MNGKINLKNAIEINGKKVKTLTYDTDAITAQQFAEADARNMRASGSKGGNLSGAVELDYSFHLYLGFAAIVAVNTEIDISDLERIKGYDVMEVMKVGRNFIMKPGEDSPADDSVEQSETTPEPSTPQSQNSKGDQ